MKYKLVFVLSALRVGGVSLQDIDIQLRGCERAQGDSAELPSLTLFRVTEGRRGKMGTESGCKHIIILLACISGSYSRLSHFGDQDVQIYSMQRHQIRQSNKGSINTIHEGF